MLFFHQAKEGFLKRPLKLFLDFLTQAKNHLVKALEPEHLQNPFFLMKVFFWICHDGDSEGLAVLGTTVGTRGGYLEVCLTVGLAVSTVGLASIPAMKIDESGQVIPPSEEGW